MHQRGLSVAVTTAQHHPELGGVAGKEVGQGRDVGRRAFIIDKGAVAEGHFGPVGCGEQIDGLLA